MTRKTTTDPDEKCPDAKFPARLPGMLFERIREKARANNRSINQEIVHGMTQYLDGLDELELLIASVKRQLVAIQTTEELPA
ncbi:Arc family DNA-binding protein [Pseudomonas sp. PDM26]|uniref:Arc family DNA-binding protein n=1 Tax=Pseudomonas sp. PDM26 TaxID=2854766 RepID=UPI001C448C71|nr:Arc family DNA-binding protein [Pseudomonas sp. PDM26]MBV7547469.1 Arc family DNA-binding protein [Pseudomonas sp. PDM26]